MEKMRNRRKVKTWVAACTICSWAAVAASGAKAEGSDCEGEEEGDKFIHL